MPTFRCRAPALLALAVLTCLPGSAGAQGRAGAPEIRVVEILDPATNARSREVVPDLTPSEIRRVQEALRAHGIRLRWLSGELDAATRDALFGFQEERGLVACGCISYETVVALGLRPSVVTTVLAGPGETPSPLYGSTLFGSAVVYPVPVPVLVPPGPQPGEGDGDGETPGPGPAGVSSEPPNRPGIRPAPPGRVWPSAALGPQAARPAPPPPNVVR